MSCFFWDEGIFTFLVGALRIDLDGNKLAPAVSYPVPVGTPLISPLVQWDHSQTWDVPKVEDFPSSSGGSGSATIYNIGEKKIDKTNAEKVSFALRNKHVRCVFDLRH